jgi:hypothetical protein
MGSNAVSDTSATPDFVSSQSRELISHSIFFSSDEAKIILSLFVFSLTIRSILVFSFPYNLFPDGYTHLANALLIRNGFLSLTLPWGWLILYYLFLAPFLFGLDPLLNGRIISILMWSISTVLIYLLARHLNLDKRTSTFSALLFSVTPYNLIISTTTMNDDLLVVFFFASLIYFVRFSREESFWNGLSLIVFMIVASFTRIEGVVLAVILATVFCYKVIKQKNWVDRKRGLLVIISLCLLSVAVFLHITLLLSPLASEPSNYVMNLISPHVILENLITYGRYTASLPSMLTPLLFFLGTVGIILLLMKEIFFEMKSIIFISLVFIFIYPALLLPRMGDFVLHAFPKYHVYALGLICIFSANWIIPTVTNLIRETSTNQLQFIKLHKYKVKRTTFSKVIVFFLFATIIGVTLQASYIEMNIHARIMRPYYSASLWVQSETNNTNNFLIQRFSREGIIYHGQLLSTQVVNTEDLPDTYNATFNFIVDNHISYLIWAKRDPVCLNNPLLAQLSSGANQTHFILVFKFEDFVNELHEIVLIYKFEP